MLVAESAIFALTAPNFATSANAAEIVRLAVEVGLLALALTPIVVTGGIDLSCGALLGLRAVVLGALWRDAGWPAVDGRGGALAAGAAGGALNALAHRALELPPLMVTLGSLSLFRGLAEGLTGGVDNYTGLPPRFLALGQGFVGAVPAQAPWLLLAALGVLGRAVHRTTRGRAYFAIGHNAGRRHGTRGSTSPGASAELYVALGAGRRAGGYHLRRAPRTGQGRRGHRLRADGDHGRRARRHGDHRRQSARSAARCSGCRRWWCCRTGCGSRRCRRNWPAC